MKNVEPIDNDVIKTAKGIVRWFTSTARKTAVCESVPEVIKSAGWGLFVGVLLNMWVFGATVVTGFSAVIVTGGFTALFFNLGRCMVKGFKRLSAWSYRDE